MVEKRSWTAKKGARRGTNNKTQSHDNIEITDSERKALDYKKEYDRHTYRQIGIALNVDTEKELINYLDGIDESPKKLFARLIKADMAEKNIGNRG